MRNIHVIFENFRITQKKASPYASGIETGHSGELLSRGRLVSYLLKQYTNLNSIVKFAIVNITTKVIYENYKNKNIY